MITKLLRTLGRNQNRYNRFPSLSHQFLQCPVPMHHCLSVGLSFLTKHTAKSSKHNNSGAHIFAVFLFFDNSIFFSDSFKLTRKEMLRWEGRINMPAISHRHLGQFKLIHKNKLHNRRYVGLKFRILNQIAPIPSDNIHSYNCCPTIMFIHLCCFFFVHSPALMISKWLSLIIVRTLYYF